jgi:signal transduction histidine kinase
MMKKLSTEKLVENFSFLSKNPQIVYTVFLLIIIPVAFLYSGQNFLSVSVDNQERLEQERIGSMQDIFVEFAPLFLNDSSFLKQRINRIKEQNTNIVDFKILKKTSSGYEVSVSLNDKEVGKIDDDPLRTAGYDLALSGKFYIVPFQQEDGRHWIATRGFSGVGTSTGQWILYNDISMASVDALFNSNKQGAYIMLSFIILAIGFLLMRQARVLDYAVLYKRLKEVDQMKDDFVSMAAHELRTPLTIIRGYTEMLTESKHLTEDDLKLTANIENSANHLNQLIGDILDVSRLQQGRLSFKLIPTQPVGIIDPIVESLKYTAKQKGLTLEYTKKEDGTINVDTDRLKQILINVVGNAVKYTPTGGVTVTSYVEKDQYVVRVSDTGIGISAEDQKNLFARFYRVKSKETEDIRGTGLGLWITKEIITQMNGIIYVESIKGKGTDFILSFPLVKAEVKK